MKARVIETGKVIEVTIDKCATPIYGSGATSIYKGNNDGKTYYNTELDFINIYPDWQQVRIQAAIAAMQAILLDGKREISIFENVSYYAVRHADALIAELKKTI